jgi:hypothetical protein
LESARALNDKVSAIFDAEAKEATRRPDFLIRRRREIQSTLETMLSTAQAGE